MKRLLLPLFSLALLLTSCGKDYDTAGGLFPIQPGKGFFALSEENSGSLDYIRYEDGKYFTDIYRLRNGKDIGAGMTDAAIYRDRAYIALNKSDRIEAVSVSDFKSVGAIAYIPQPRKMFVLPSGKAYVTSDAGYYYLVDLPGLTILDSINLEMAIATNAMTLMGDRVFAVGGNVLIAMDTLTNQVVLQHGFPLWPNIHGLASDQEERLWVYAPGYSWFSNPGTLLRVRISSNIVHVEKELYVPLTHDLYQKGKILIHKPGNILYVWNGLSVYRLDVEDDTFPSTSFISPEAMRNSSAIAVHPSSGIIYIAHTSISGGKEGRKVTRYNAHAEEMESYDVSNEITGFLFY